MKTKLLLLTVAVLPLAACSSIKTVEMTLRGHPDQNPNADGEATSVAVRVLRLKGAEAAQAFTDAAFDDVWSDPIKADNVLIDVPPQSLYVRPNSDTVTLTLEKVPPAITHIGVLALFEKPVPQRDRVLLTRDDVYDYEVVVHGYELHKREPGAGPPPENP